MTEPNDQKEWTSPSGMAYRVDCYQIFDLYFPCCLEIDGQAEHYWMAIFKEQYNGLVHFFLDDISDGSCKDLDEFERRIKLMAFQ